MKCPQPCLPALTMHQTQGSQYRGKAASCWGRGGARTPSPLLLAVLSLLEWTCLPRSQVTLGPRPACSWGSTGGSH